MGELNPNAREFKLATSEVGLPVAVWLAAAGGDQAQVVAWLDGWERTSGRLVESGGVDACCAEHAGGTLLSAAAVGGQYHMIMMLLSRGASINLQDSFGSSALMYAAFKGRDISKELGVSDIVHALLDAKADASQRDGMGKTALMWAEQESHTATAALLRQHVEQQAEARAEAGRLIWKASQSSVKQTRSLEKKLRQIVELKELVESGKTLETNQLEKIYAEPAVRAELAELQRTARLDADAAAASHGAKQRTDTDRYREIRAERLRQAAEAAESGFPLPAPDRFERSIIRVGPSGSVTGLPGRRGVNLVGPPGATMPQWEYDQRAREYEQEQREEAEGGEEAEEAEGSRSSTPSAVSRYAQRLCSHEPAPDEVVWLTLHRTGLAQAWGVRLAGAERSRVVELLRPDGVAWRQGLRVGDVLLTIDGEHAGGHAAMSDALRQALALTLKVARCQHRIAAETLQRYQRGFAARWLCRTVTGVAAEAAAGVAEARARAQAAVAAVAMAAGTAAATEATAATAMHGEEEMLCCPITTQEMLDPVITLDGHTYERAAILAWFLKSATSPMTGEPLASTVLTPNMAIKKQCAQRRAERAAERAALEAEATAAAAAATSAGAFGSGSGGHASAGVVARGGRGRGTATGRGGRGAPTGPDHAEGAVATAEVTAAARTPLAAAARSLYDRS